MDESTARVALEVGRYGRLVEETLRPDDPRLAGTARLTHADGSTLTFAHAFLETVGDWVYVFTRDHGCFCYHRDALTACHADPADPHGEAPGRAGDAAAATANDAVRALAFHFDAPRRA